MSAQETTKKYCGISKPMVTAKQRFNEKYYTFLKIKRIEVTFWVKV